MAVCFLTCVTALALLWTLSVKKRKSLDTR